MREIPLRCRNKERRVLENSLVSLLQVNPGYPLMCGLDIAIRCLEPDIS